ncbi:MAG TPA: FecR family protein, partial [Spirochaetota bacterium]|nr:FecR family protein [Spirochaetota bacterium]
MKKKTVNLNDNDISKILKTKVDYQEVPDYLDKNVFNLIENEKGKKSPNLKDNSYFVNIFKYSFSISLILIIIFCGYYFFNSQNQLKITKIASTGDILINKSNIFDKKSYKVDKETKVFKINEKIITKDNSFCDIQTGNQSAIKILNNSELSFKKNSKDNISINLSKGSAIFLVKKESVPYYFVETDSAIITVKGTHFVVENDENDLTKVFVKEGVVSVKNKFTGKEIILNKNESVAVKNEEEKNIPNEQIRVSSEDFNQMKIKNLTISKLVQIDTNFENVEIINKNDNYKEIINSKEILIEKGVYQLQIKYNDKIYTKEITVSEKNSVFSFKKDEIESYKITDVSPDKKNTKKVIKLTKNDKVLNLINNNGFIYAMTNSMIYCLSNDFDILWSYLSEGKNNLFVENSIKIFDNF